MVKYRSKIIIRYTLLQLPGIFLLAVFLLIISHWIHIPPLILWGVIILWVSKDIVLFFYTWPAYDWEHRDSMINAFGVAMDRIIDRGYIMVNSEQWMAEPADGEQAFEKGQKVLITGRKGLVLQIKHTAGDSDNRKI